jgi:adenine phosphoribosyltransferase
LRLEDFIRDVPDFPKPGIMFKDITPLLGSSEAFRASVERLAGPWRDAEIDKIAGIESRGFIFGAAAAQLLGCGFVPIRKPGKLPWKSHRHEYDLEYGTDALEIHQDAFGASERVLIVDDVLATGGTAAAAGSLVRNVGAEVVGYAMVIELSFLGGREKLDGARFHSTIRY